MPAVFDQMLPGPDRRTSWVVRYASRVQWISRLDLYVRGALPEAFIRWAMFFVFALSAINTTIWGESQLGVVLQDQYHLSQSLAKVLVVSVSFCCSVAAILWLSSKDTGLISVSTMVFLLIGTLHIVGLLVSGSAEGCGCGYKPAAMDAKVFNIASLAKNVVLEILAIVAFRHRSSV
jgi:hypothetical protein